MVNLYKLNPRLEDELSHVEVDVVDHTSRCLFDWRNNPPKAPHPHSEYYEGQTYLDQLEEYSEKVFTDSILQRLLMSRTFMAMIEHHPDLENMPVNVQQLNKNAGAKYFHEPEKASLNSLSVGPNGDDMTAYAYLIAHEYRHGWHKRIGIFDRVKEMTMQDIMLLNRAYEADCAAFQITFAWDLHVLGDGSHLDFQQERSAYTNCVSVFLQKMKEIEEGLDEWDWEDYLEDGKYPNETGEAQQAAFEAFFTKRSLKLSYDAHALDVYQIASCRRKYKIDPVRSRELLIEKIRSLESMPYINDQGGTAPRYGYRPEKLFAAKDKRFLFEVKEAPTLLRMRHLSQRRQPQMPRPPHI
ncbi:MAG: DUF6782 family putative metallopeptidase [Pseudomonadota bacterium]